MTLKVTDRTASEVVTRVYEERDSLLPLNDWKVNVYHARHPMGSLLFEHDRAKLIKVLATLDLDVRTIRVLDLGCGTGRWLRMLIDFGAQPSHLYGVDLSTDRIRYAKESNAELNLFQGDIRDVSSCLPEFDLILCVLVFSSMADANYCVEVAQKLNNHLRPNGMIIWVDLGSDRLGLNSKLRGFSATEVRELFPNLTLEYADRMYPSYFRRFYKKLRPLASFISQLTNFNCECNIFALRKYLSEVG